jgi:hypothetical protein
MECVKSREMIKETSRRNGVAGAAMSKQRQRRAGDTID